MTKEEFIKNIAAILERLENDKKVDVRVFTEDIYAASEAYFAQLEARKKCTHEQVSLVRRACKCNKCGRVMESEW